MRNRVWIFGIAGLVQVFLMAGIGLAGEPVRDVWGRTGAFCDGVPDSSGYQGESRWADDPGREHIVVDFEGYLNNDLIGTVTGVVDVSFGPSWVAVIDADAPGYGSGNFANEPSPDTVAAGLYSSDASPINFSDGVRQVIVAYSAGLDALPLVMRAYDGPDGTGSMVDEAIGHVLGNSAQGADCQGDPNGQFCKWGFLSVYSDNPDIHSVTFPGAPSNWFLIDDFRAYPNFQNEVPSTEPVGLALLVLLISVVLIFRGRRS